MNEMRQLVEKVFGPVTDFSQFSNVTRWRVDGLNYAIEDCTEEKLRALMSSQRLTRGPSPAS